MVRYIRSALTPQEYNDKQDSVGTTLKTYKGSPIKRSKYGVGKEIGGQIYFHKDYAERIVPVEILEACEEALDYYYSDLHYNYELFFEDEHSLLFFLL